MTSLCKYSRSEVYATDILAECPLKLTDSEHDLCWCSKRVDVPHKSNPTVSLRVLACTYPRLWNNRRIYAPYEIAQKIRFKHKQRLKDQQQEVATQDHLFEETVPMSAEPQVAAQPKPLWEQPIPIIGLTGKYASGKTLFGLQLDPARTRVYDTEKSCETYSGLGFDRVDVPREMMQKYPNGYKPIDTYMWWAQHIKAIKPGQYRVIVLDTALEIEAGIADWVTNNPGHFGKTKAQYLKMSGLMWGDMMSLWKALLSDLASRCETFVFTVHMGDEYVGGSRTGKKKPKGKTTLMELSSLFLQMEREPDKDGNKPQVPSAINLKSRLAHTRIDPVEGVKIISALPPRLPVATPAAINEYLRNPPDWDNLKPEERAPEHIASEEEMERLRTQRAEAEAEANRLQIERMDRDDRRAQLKADREARAAEEAGKQLAPQPVQSQPQPSNNGNGKQESPPQEKHPNHDLLETVLFNRNHLFQIANIEDPVEQAEKWDAILQHYGVTSAKKLSRSNLEDLIRRLQAKADQVAKELQDRQPDDMPF